jgi:hypothetical protein
MPTMARILDLPTPEFRHQAIHVRRYRVANSNVHQTVYFPSPETNVYRASITGDLMIVESAAQELDSLDTKYTLRPFGLHRDDVTEIEQAEQRFGKISPIDDGWRKRFIFELSAQHGVYSFGRFATWRNLLLDDLVQDLDVIKKLISSSSYDNLKKSL